MDSLVTSLLNGKSVVFVTGNALSVASGIPPFRGKSNAIWNKFQSENATRTKFLSDPLKWYNSYWLKAHEKPIYTSASPNRGHKAIAHISKRCPRSRVVTQNIDGLHCKTTPCLGQNQLVEVHGHMGLYKCINVSCPKTQKCIELDIRRYDQRWKHDDINEAGTTGIAVGIIRRSPRKGSGDGRTLKSSTNKDRLENVEHYKLKSVPRCPRCDGLVLPNALLFDEKYDSHPFYEYKKALQWLEEADVIVFVGVNFSVGLACDALERAARDFKPVYNFNTQRDDVLQNLSENRGLREASRILNALRIIHIVGRPEQSLAMLAWAVDHAARLHGALVTAEICPPVSPGLPHSPRITTQMMRRKREILESFEIFPEWDQFDSSADRERVQEIVSGNSNSRTMSPTPQPFPLSDTEKLSDEVAVGALRRLGSGRGGRKRRRTSKGLPPRYPRGRGRGNKVSIPWKMIPNEVKKNVRNNATPTSSSRSMLPIEMYQVEGEDENEDDDLTLSEEEEEQEQDIEEWEGVRGTPTTPSMSRSRSYVPTSRGGFVIEQVSDASTATPAAADDAASILAMLNTPRVSSGGRT